MVVTAPVSPAVIWHDLECGAYTADLPLWRELAMAAAPRDGAGARVLDIGAGTGRVALDLARAGHSVTALDIDPELLAAVSDRASGLAVETVRADARDFALAHRDFDLCLVPMQTLQLLRGSAERAGLFACARAHVREGALIACALVGEVDEFDSRAGGLGPSPERVQIGGSLYMSRAMRIARENGAFVIDRERLVIGSGDRPPAPTEHDRVELEILEEGSLREELRAAGFEPQLTRTIAETDEHSGSEVVIGRA
ncbi:MAG TPA: class I SAM-dependent methyltransferase [Solirubrobacteraceae bacterium]|nr:class I SAM-dependent methyltransferase [Solirubrobacteraceae bacterium]